MPQRIDNKTMLSQQNEIIIFVKPLIKSADIVIYLVLNLSHIIPANICTKPYVIKIIVNDCTISNIETGTLGQKYRLYACNDFKNLTDYYGVKDIIITTENISLTDDDYKALNTTEFTEINFSSSLKNFMKKIKKSETNNKYRIIVEFQNNEFATLKMEN